MKKLLIALLVICLLPLAACSSETIEIPEEEQAYIDSVLSQITKVTTKADAIALLGEPDRKLDLKIIWAVEIAGRESKVEVFFNAQSGTATGFNLNGDTVKFKYHKDLLV